MRSLLNILTVLLAASCIGGKLPDDPDRPETYSMPFECSYSGYVVLRGWLVVDAEKVEQIEQAGVNIYDYWLECESAIYNSLKCQISEQA
jgi:hypothetical protein